MRAPLSVANQGLLGSFTLAELNAGYPPQRYVNQTAFVDNGTGVIPYGYFVQSDGVSWKQQILVDPTTRATSAGGVTLPEFPSVSYPLLPSYSVLASPPTVVPGTVNGTTQISGAVLIESSRTDAFLYSGGPLSYDISLSRPVIGNYSGGTINVNGAIEFTLVTADATGRFEVSMQGSTVDANVGRFCYRLPGQTQWNAFTIGPGYSIPNNGNYLVLVTMGAAGTYEIRWEGVRGMLDGVRVTSGSSISALPPKTGPRVFIPGDSYTNPTIMDTFATSYADGWAQQLAVRTGFDVWAQPCGGTGYLATNNGANLKFRDRFNIDTEPYIRPGDIVFVAGGDNDLGYITNVTNYATPALGVAALAQECATYFSQIVATGAILRVLSPFRPQGMELQGAGCFLAICDTIKAACIAAGGQYIDIISLPQNSLTSSWAGTTIVATGVSQRLCLGDIPAAFKPGATAINAVYFKIGSGVNQQVARASYVDAFNGSNNSWQVQFSAQVTYANWPIGTPVVACGASYLTGNGNISSPNGTGDADIFVGTDAAHPTRLGHLSIVNKVAPLFLASL